MKIGNLRQFVSECVWHSSEKGSRHCPSRAFLFCFEDLFVFWLW